MHELDRLIRRTRRRLRLQRALEALVTGTMLWVLELTLLVFLAKLGLLSGAGLALWAAAGLLLTLAYALALAARPLPAGRVAKLIDTTHGLHDRLSTAIEFGQLAAAEGFVQAQLADALRHAGSASPALASPWRWPRDAKHLAGTLVCLGVMLLLRFPAADESRPPPPPALPRLLVEAQDLEPYRSLAAELARTAQKQDLPELDQLAAQLNQLFEQIQRQQLTRKELLSKLAELQRKIMEGLPGDFEELLKRLKKMGGELQRERLTEELGRALDKAELDQARRELDQLAQKLATLQLPQQKQLARSLERAARQKLGQAAAQTQRDRLEQQRRRLQRQLQKDPQNTELKRRLQRNKRQLQRLNQQLKRQAEQRRQLQRLNQQLQRAAANLRQQLSPEAQKALEEAARQLQRFAQQKNKLDKLSKAQGQLADLKELLRRLGKGQQGKQSQLKDFYVRAKGKQGKDGKGKDGKGKDGKGKDGKMSLLIDPDGKQGALIVPVPLPGGQQQQASNTPGDEAGDGTDPQLQGQATRLPAKHKDVRIKGAEGAGPNRSEVILGAAGEGFASQSYQRVYQDYTEIVEDVLKQEDVPLGYKHFVKRYFQLIKPR